MQSVKIAAFAELFPLYRNSLIKHNLWPHLLLILSHSTFPFHHSPPHQKSSFFMSLSLSLNLCVHAKKKYLADDVEHLYTSFNNGTSISERDFIRSHLHNSFLRALCMSLSLIFSFLIVYHEAFVTQLFSRSCTNHLVESKSVFFSVA